VVPLSKDILVHAVMGSEPPFGGFEDLTRWTGNQHNESWAWIREKLEEKSEDYLMELYMRLNQ
jgi:hypothetical protein